MAVHNPGYLVLSAALLVIVIDGGTKDRHFSRLILLARGVPLSGKWLSLPQGAGRMGRTDLRYWWKERTRCGGMNGDLVLLPGLEAECLRQ